MSSEYKKVKVKKQTTRAIERHRLLLKMLSDNISNGMSMDEAMIAVGYSKSYAKSSTHLKETEAWQTLMDEQLPDKLLAKKHNALLKKKEVIFKTNSKTGKIDVIHTEEIDVNAVKAGVDMGYKLKGKYAPDKHEHQINEKTDEELEDILAEKIALIATNKDK